MKKIITIILFLLSATAMLQAQNETKYRRSSLYSVLVSHNEERFGKQIEDAFLEIPIPDKFDNHDLSVKVVSVSKKQKASEDEISSFLQQNGIAKRLVSKWFNRDKNTGECDVDMIIDRGLWNASVTDVLDVKSTELGTRQLADAGEELLNNTFVLVNDIHYFDKSKVSKGFSIFAQVLISAAGSVVGVNASDIASAVGDLIKSIKGFSVTATSYLYRLEWNDDIAGEFYSSQYVPRGSTDDVKKRNFEKSGNYRLVFVGSQTVKSGDVTMKGLDDYDLGGMVKKVCTRTIDKAIVALQKKHDEFKVKTAVISVDGKTLSAYIGEKEGVQENALYEILLPSVDASGRTIYKRVGTAKPVKGRIWDNRYMAEFEVGKNANTLKCTDFTIVSGTGIAPGMLLKEVHM